MAGRSLSAARAAAQAERIRQASETPTPRRTEPATYADDLPAEALALASIGMTFVEIADHWAISEEELKEWEKAHLALAEALRRARTRAKAWWTRQPRLAISEKDNKFPAGAWAQQVRALFPEYDDKKGVTVQVDLGALVKVIVPEPLQERVSGASSPLIEHGTVGLSQSPTVTLSSVGSATDAPRIALASLNSQPDEDPPGAGG